MAEHASVSLTPHYLDILFELRGCVQRHNKRHKSWLRHARFQRRQRLGSRHWSWYYQLPQTIGKIPAASIVGRESGTEVVLRRRWLDCSQRAAASDPVDNAIIKFLLLEFITARAHDRSRVAVKVRSQAFVTWMYCRKLT